jgi:hypothetical protein
MWQSKAIIINILQLDKELLFYQNSSQFLFKSLFFGDLIFEIKIRKRFLIKLYTIEIF